MFRVATRTFGLTMGITLGFCLNEYVKIEALNNSVKNAVCKTNPDQFLPDGAIELNTDNVDYTYPILRAKKSVGLGIVDVVLNPDHKSATVYVHRNNFFGYIYNKHGVAAKCG